MKRVLTSPSEFRQSCRTNLRVRPVVSSAMGSARRTAIWFIVNTHSL